MGPEERPHAPGGAKLQPPPRRRRRLSLSLRGLMILVLIAGAPMAWKARRASLQKRAVARIKQWRGEVTYDWEADGRFSHGDEVSGPSAPPWLRRALGDEYLQEVTEVDLPYTFRGDCSFVAKPDSEVAEQARIVKLLEEDQLACLEGLEGIKALRIGAGQRLKPEGMARFGRFAPHLKELTLSDDLDADGFVRLAGMTFPNLEKLTMSLERDQDADWAFLEKMPRLRWLSLDSGRLSDENLLRVGKLRNLTRLTLIGRGLTDRGLSHLEGLHALQDLEITSLTKIDLADRAFAPLQRLPNLEVLRLGLIHIDKVGMDHLRKMPKLSWLEMPRGRLDWEIIKDFKAARPDVTVRLIY